jgi:hypothetical protein
MEANHMKLRNRVGAVILTATIGGAGALGLAACGTADQAAQAMSADASALTSLGFSDNDVTAADSTVADSPAPAPSASTDSKAGNRHRLARRLTIRRGLARNVEHGLITVQTKNGDQTIEVQRGTVTAINSTSVTVQSTDGFTLTWTFGSPIHVIEHRTTVQPTAVAVGATVGVAGLHTDSADTASLMVIPNATK